MKLSKHYVFLVTIVCLILLLSACQNQNNFSNNYNEINSEKPASTRNEIISEKPNPTKNEEQLENNEDVVWNEVTENGVNEELLVINIDEKTLTYIAQQLQDVCAEIDEKGKKDNNY